VKLFSLGGVPRADRGQQHLNNFYSGTDALGDSRFDAVIMTGTEPRSRDLRDEPYWTALGGVLDWAENNTVSTVLSCLAAHAAVLHSDGIPRHALGDKQFGVFGYTRTEHPLTRGTPEIIRNPHSRWNEVQEDALIACGYDVLTRSSEAGVDLFVKKKKKSLFVNFQGHPEYGAQTLLKEYRRDIRRFIKRERETYPTAPQGYFGEMSAKLLSDFRDRVVSSPGEDLMAEFPEAALVSTLQNTWSSSATGLYRNWLQYVASKKMDRPQHGAAGVKARLTLVRSIIT
jgi:homoserine O-succinyltransferase